MKKFLSYFSYVMYIFGFLLLYFFKSSDFAISIFLLFMCIGCIFAIPDLFEELKEYANTNHRKKCKATLDMMILGSIAFFILAIAFLPYFGL